MIKKIQKNLRVSFNVFLNSARQLEVPLILHKGGMVWARDLYPTLASLSDGLGKLNEDKMGC